MSRGTDTSPAASLVAMIVAVLPYGRSSTDCTCLNCARIILAQAIRRRGYKRFGWLVDKPRPPFEGNVRGHLNGALDGEQQPTTKKKYLLYKNVYGFSREMKS
jgi:hypothetical protein